MRYVKGNHGWGIGRWMSGRYIALGRLGLFYNRKGQNDAIVKLQN